MAKSRNWCFTLNNPQDNEIFQNNQLKMLIANLEVGAEGTPHYQGYCEFTNSVPLSTCKKLNARAHWIKRSGTQFQAIDYCLKDYTQGPTKVMYEDETLETLKNFGLLTVNVDTSIKLKDYMLSLNHRKENKLLHLKDCVDRGMGMKALWQEDFETMIRHHRNLNAYMLRQVNPRLWDMDIIVIYGPTGTGKSHYCQEKYPDAYWKQTGKWWDNYEGEETVVIDEFYGWIQWSVLLRLCDKYKMMVETKGGQVQFVSKRIIFTTNTLPILWYKDKYFDAFKRRVKTWIFMPFIHVSESFDNYENFNCSLSNINSVQV